MLQFFHLVLFNWCLKSVLKNNSFCNAQILNCFNIISCILCYRKLQFPRTCLSINIILVKVRQLAYLFREYLLQPIILSEMRQEWKKRKKNGIINSITSWYNNSLYSYLDKISWYWMPKLSCFHWYCNRKIAKQVNLSSRNSSVSFLLSSEKSWKMLHQVMCFLQ